MLRLIWSKVEVCKVFWKPSKPCHWIALADYPQMSTHLPGFQSFFRFIASICIGQISHQQHKGFTQLSCYPCPESHSKSSEFQIKSLDVVHQWRSFQDKRIALSGRRLCPCGPTCPRSFLHIPVNNRPKAQVVSLPAMKGRQLLVVNNQVGDL